ncbi:MAG TPA: tripartite tricarboxylate transporter TctB family protein [Burkholderiaceae bacterium]|nr:tripartite tricarboxylate transporter TctB family protein [Burkholderiaceae bacterium]
MRSDRMLRIAPYVAVLAIATYLLHKAGQIDYFGPPGRIGPDFWPKMVLGLLIAVCLYEIVKIGLFGRDRSSGGLVSTMSAPPSGAAEPEPPAGRSYPLRLLLAIGATVAYTALVPIAGFFLATFPYLAVFIYVGGYRRLPVVVPVALFGTLMMLFFFWRVAYVSLPIGREPFSSVSLLLMQAMGVR